MAEREVNSGEAQSLQDYVERFEGRSPQPEDTDGDGIADELRNGTDPKSATPTEQAKDRQSFAQDPAIPSLDAELEQDLQGQAPLPDVKPDSLDDMTPVPTPEVETKQPSFIDTLYQKLAKHSDLDLNNARLLVYQGMDMIYEGTPQVNWLDDITSEQQDLLQNVLDNPNGLQGELSITVNDQLIFHVKDGELKLDQYGLAGNQQLSEAQAQDPAEAPASQPAFDPSAVYNRYQQELQGQSPSSTQQAPMDAYERIAQKTLADGLTQKETSQVLSYDPFHQTLSLGLGQPEADRYNHHLLNSLGSQGKPDERVSALENRIQSLSSQLDTLIQKLDRLGQSKAFEAQSPQLNQFLGNVRTTLSNTWQEAKNALRQKAGEVSLALVAASARTSTQLFGEDTKDGLRVIDARNGRRIGLSQQGDVVINKAPALQVASEYKRLSQMVDPKLPPSLQAKQIALVALKEQFTTTQIQSILNEHPKVKEIHSYLGSDKANQFAGVAIAAAQRQNAIDSQPQQREPQKQQQRSKDNSLSL